MRVVRIEIFGFKSFMDRLILPIEGGVTGVVGPNGCGKSNIVDALRWVLGETNAKNLRGGLLEDVIFNGTDALRPLGLAEVTLTLKASGDTFFQDLVSPDLEAELYAAGGGETQDSAQQEDLKSLGQQVQASQSQEEDETELTEPDPVSESPEQLRKQFTVVKGNLNTSVESESDQSGDAREASCDLDAAVEREGQTEVTQAPSTDGAMISLASRFSWLRASSEVQVTRRLYRSGESEFFINRVPCRLKDLKEFFRAVGISARAYTIVAQGEVSRIVTAKPEERRLILEEAAGVLGFRDKIAAADRRLKDTELNISRIEDITKEVGRQVQSLKRQAQKAQNRKQLKDRVRELESLLFADELRNLKANREKFIAQKEEFQNLESNVLAELQNARAQEENARAELMQYDIEGDNIRSRIDAVKEEINNRARQRGERTSRINELRAFSLSKETESTRLKERESTLEQRRSENAGQLEELTAREVSLAAELHSLSQDDETQLRTAADKLSALREELREHEQRAREVRERLARAQGQLEFAEKQLVSASPVERLKESSGIQSEEILGKFAAEASLLVDGLQVPGEYAAALQSVLGDRAGFLVSKQPFALARHFTEQVLSKEMEESIGIGVLFSEEISSQSSPADSELPTVPFTPLRNLIGAIPTCEAALGRVLDQVYLCDRLEQALDFFESLDDQQRLTSHSKIVLVTRDGELISSTSFYSFRHEGGLVQLKSKTAEFKQLCAGLEQDNQKLRAERNQIQEVLSEAEEAHRLALAESQQRQKRARELSNELGSIRGRLQAERRLVAQIEGDIERVKRQQEENRAQIEGYRVESDKIMLELEQLAQDEDQDLHHQLRAMNEEYLKIDDERRSGRETLSKLAREVEVVRGRLDSQRSALSDLELHLQKVDLAKENLIGRIQSEYGEDYLSQMESLDDTSEIADEEKDQAREELGRLKQRIQREGEVDPSSIEQYEEERVRLENLETQRDDLTQAASTLRKTIARLQQTSVERFLATFEQVQQNFAQLVPRMFGGGKGALELEDPSRPLETGVSIIARPPGKKLKSIDLLSGGEKALCATAMIFSMFLVRPSPLCVLDEVDAPLDDANLVRFLSVIKEMSSKTQFILITHNKASMAASDKLVGVTMEQPGASKVITVSLQEAYGQVA